MTLTVRELDVGYAGVSVLRRVSLVVRPGQVVGVVGPNGSGKSTLLRAVGGLLGAFGGRQTGGEILLADRPLAGLSASALVHLGVISLVEGRRVFRGMTVRENLEVGSSAIRDSSSPGLHGQRALGYFPALEPLLDRCAGTLSGGEQQMVAIGRAVSMNPKFLLLDEPSQGLAPRLVVDLFGRLKTLASSHGVGLLVVEQRVHHLLRFADEVVALGRGQVEFSGDAGGCAKNPEMFRKLFLGPSR